MPRARTQAAHQFAASFLPAKKALRLAAIETARCGATTIEVLHAMQLPADLNGNAAAIEILEGMKLAASSYQRMLKAHEIVAGIRSAIRMDHSDFGPDDTRITEVDQVPVLRAA